jgi:hypothetical protein
MRQMVAAIALCAAVALVMPVAGARQDQASALKYRLRVAPGNLQVDRMPGPGPVVVTRADKPDEVVWQWSHGQMFCMHVTDIKIAAGGRWKHTEAWKFSVADVKDGKYRATATFLATKQTATAEFEVTSVQ